MELPKTETPPTTPPRYSLHHDKVEYREYVVILSDNLFGTQCDVDKGRLIVEITGGTKGEDDYFYTALYQTTPDTLEDNFFAVLQAMPQSPMGKKTDYWVPENRTAVSSLSIMGIRQTVNWLIHFEQWFMLEEHFGHAHYLWEHRATGGV